MIRTEQARPLERPTLTESITGLLLTDTRYGIEPTAEEIDAAEVIRHVDTTHQGSDHCDNPGDPDPLNRTWGTCTTCREVWPCRTWTDAHALAVEFTGRAHNRYRARAEAALARIRNRQEAP